VEQLSRAALQAIADQFKLLSCPTRLELLQHICEQERTVGELQELTGFKQANVSRHLTLLDRAGLVHRRVDGNRVYYGLADPTLPTLCGIIKDSLRARQERLEASLE
jgi:DNA-binding transcriptional ArsR family regulator